MFVPATVFRNALGQFGSTSFDEVTGEERKAPNFARTTTIKNPIKAHWDYAEAKRDFNPGKRGVEDITYLLARYGEEAWRTRAANRGFFR